MLGDWCFYRWKAPMFRCQKIHRKIRGVSSQKKTTFVRGIPIQEEQGFLVGGWATPLKNMKVNWDDEIPNIWENKQWQPNHQPVLLCEFLFCRYLHHKKYLGLYTHSSTYVHPYHWWYKHLHIWSWYSSLHGWKTSTKTCCVWTYGTFKSIGVSHHPSHPFPHGIAIFRSYFMRVNQWKINRPWLGMVHIYHLQK